jgi:hypothetical protein
VLGDSLRGQLNLQMVAGLAFRFYSEARITFMPTYKYDIGTDNYDTSCVAPLLSMLYFQSSSPSLTSCSEKARIPAWTDRILRKGPNLRQLAYNSAPLRFSDHRPVYAIFECTVSIVNQSLRDKISQEIYERRKAEVGERTANIDTEETDDEDLIGYDSIEPGLPPASSDRQKWWLDNGKLARSTIAPPNSMDASTETILNPKRPHNPFVPTEEPDWVSIPSRSRLSSFSSMSTSPYEHVSHSTILSTSASSSGQRKLPPPYDPAALPAKVGRSNLDRDTISYRDEPPPPPPPRRQNGTPVQGINRAQTMPHTTGLGPTSRKQVPTSDPAPPPRRDASVASQQPPNTKNPPAVARKPAHLAAISPRNGSPTLAGSEVNGHVAARPQLPVRSSTGSMGALPRQGGDGALASPKTLHSALSRELAEAPPQLPRRNGTSMSTAASGRQSPAGGVSLRGLSDGRPKPPARKPVMVSQPMDLLGDDDSAVGAGGWEALKPTSS